MMDEIGDKAGAAGKIVRICEPVTVVRVELLSSRGSLEKSAMRGHRKVCDSLREAAGRTSIWMASVFL